MKIELNQKYYPVIVLTWVILSFGIIFIAVFLPLKQQRQDLEEKIAHINNQCALADQFIQQAHQHEAHGRFLSRDEVTLALSEISKASQAHKVGILSTMPFNDQLQDKTNRVAMMFEMEGAYQDIGLLMGDLIRLKNCVVAVRKLELKSRHGATQILKGSVIVDIYIKE